MQCIDAFRTHRQWEELILGSALSNSTAEYEVPLEQIDFEKVDFVPQYKLKSLILQHMMWMIPKLALKLLTQKICPNVERLSVLGTPLLQSNFFLDKILSELIYVERFTLGEPIEGQNNKFDFDSKTPLEFGKHVKHLRIGFARGTNRHSEELWPWVFRSFPAVKKLKIFSSTSASVYLAPKFWKDLREYGKSINTLVLADVAGVNCEEFLEFVQTTSRMQKIKIDYPWSSLKQHLQGSRCQVITVKY